MAFASNTAIALARSTAANTGMPTTAEVQAAHELVARLSALHGSLSPAAAGLLATVVNSATPQTPAARKVSMQDFHFVKKVDKASA